MLASTCDGLTLWWDGCQVMRDWGCGQFITGFLYPSFQLRKRILMSSPSIVGSLLQQPVPHKLIQCVSFVSFHGLQFFINYSSMCPFHVLQEQVVPVLIPNRVTGPVGKPVPVWTPLSTGPSGPCSSTSSSFHGAMGLARSLFQCGLPT